jgi:hypothetical protein
MAITYQFEDEGSGNGLTYQFEDTQVPNQTSAPDMPWYQNAAIGVGAGMTNLGIGALQRVLEGGEKIRQLTGMQSNQPNIDRLTQMVEENRSAMKPLAEKSTAANVGSFLGEVLPTIPVPGGVAGGALRRAGTSALAGGGVGFIQPTGKDDSVLQNTVMGAGAGGAMSGVLSGVGKVGNSIFNQLPANFREALSQKYKVPITLGESIASPNLQRVETGMERIPLLGLVGFREKQLKAADDAAKSALGKYMINPTATDVMESNRQYSSGLFNTLADKVEDIEKQAIIPDATRTTALEMQDSLSDMFKMFQNTKRERLLKNIISDTSDKTTINKTDGVHYLSPDEWSTTSTPATMTFKDAWELRDSLGQMIGQAKKKLSGGDTDRTQLAEWSKLYGAVNKDIDEWINANGRPDIKEAISSANNAYKHYVVKYDKLQDAYDASVRIKDGEKSFIPERFSSEIQKIIKRDKEYKSFSQSELQELDGLAKIMQVVNRAGKYKENLPTGDRWGLPISIGAGAGAIASPAATGSVLGTVGLIRVLTGTEYGKRLLLSASKMKSTNPNLEILLKMGYNQIPKIAATGATRDY